MANESGVVHLWVPPQVRFKGFVSVPAAMGVHARSVRNEVRLSTLVNWPSLLVLMSDCPFTFEDAQSPPTLVPSTSEISFPPKALNESFVGEPLLSFPSAYVSVALIVAPNSFKPPATVVVKAMETLAVPPPATLPNEHVIIAAGTGGAARGEQSACGLTETAVTLSGSVTLITVCVAVAEP